MPCATCTQLERYLQGRTLGDFTTGEVTFFRLREGEAPQVAANRLRAQLKHWPWTMLSRWSVKPKSDGLLVRKIGTFDLPFDLPYKG